MLRVRFPNGTMIQYNDATQVQRNATEWAIMGRKGDGWLAIIQPSAGVIIEAVYPCAIRNELEIRPADQKVIQEQARAIDKLKRELKKAKAKR